MSGGCSSAPLQEKYALKLRFRSFERAVPPLQPKETLQIEQRPTLSPWYSHHFTINSSKFHSPTMTPRRSSPCVEPHLPEVTSPPWLAHPCWPVAVKSNPHGLNIKIPHGNHQNLLPSNPQGVSVSPSFLLPQKSPGLVVPHRLLVEASFQLHRGHAHHGVQRPARGPPRGQGLRAALHHIQQPAAVSVPWEKS